MTGSSSGIGRAVAERLAGDGYKVVLADLRREPLAGGEPTDELIARSGGECDFLRADVARREDCERVVQRAVAWTGSLDVLVNNAAIAGEHSRPLLQTEDEDWDAIFAVNLRGPFMLCRAAICQMLGQPKRGDARGRIVNITS
ncbi:MAG: SDR family NAD(P)-dependent oxidoreductase, partial [Acidimicrobiales bacterium]